MHARSPSLIGTPDRNLAIFAYRYGRDRNRCGVIAQYNPVSDRELSIRHSRCPVDVKERSPMSPYSTANVVYEAQVGDNKYPSTGPT